jgi:prepilin peptidase CpaA
MVHEHSPIMIALLLLFVAVIAVVDLLTRRIPNWLTVSGALIAAAVHTWTSGASGSIDALAGLIAGLAAFLPFYLAGGFGAGDVKAMGAIGAILGIKGALLAAAWTLITGAIGGLGVLILHGALPSLLARMHRWAQQVHATYASGRLQFWESAPLDLARRRFPYGLAIACGTVVSVFGNQP